MVEVIEKMDWRFERGESVYNKVLLGIFKKEIDEESWREFTNHGFDVIDLPGNSYMVRDK